MLGVNVVCYDNFRTITIIQKIANESNALGIARHVHLFQKLIVGDLDAKEVVFTVAAKAGKLQKLFSVNESPCTDNKVNCVDLEAARFTEA